MGRLNKAAGAVALLCLAVSVNTLVWIQDLLSPWVWLPLGAALALGILWTGVVLWSALARSSLAGRAAGGLNAMASSAVFLGICIVIYAFFSAWDESWDLTAEGRRELSPQTIQVLQSMTEEVRVVCFFLKVEDQLVLIARDKTMRFLDQCQKYTDLLRVELLDPQIDRARLEALEIGTFASVQGTVVIRAGVRQKVITLSGGSPRIEEREFTNSLINVMRSTEPKVCFLTGHRERDILNEDEKTGASMLGNLLTGESYQAERIAIKIGLPEIPKDCDVLVMNNPQGDLLPEEIRALQEYLDAGGRVLLLIDPWKQVRPGVGGGERLRPWLEERYGIIIGSDITITDQKENIWEAELSPDSAPFADIDEGFMEYRGSFRSDHAVTRTCDQTMLLQVNRTVRLAEELPAGVVGTELLRTTPDFWAESDVAKLAEAGEAKKDEGEEEGPLSLAAAVVARSEGVEPARREARIVVVGNSSFASNGGLQVPGHLNFVLNAIAWLCENEDLIAIRPSGKVDLPVFLSPVEQRAVAWVSILFTVQGVAIVGVGVYLWRRKRQ